MAGSVHLCKARLDDFRVPQFRGADKIVVGEIQPCGEGFPALRHFIAISLCLFALRGGDLLDFLPVFVQAGEKENLLTQTPMRPGDHVSDDFFVGMTEMRLAIHVVDRGRDVETLAHVRGSLADTCQVGNADGGAGVLTRRKDSAMDEASHTNHFAAKEHKEHERVIVGLEPGEGRNCEPPERCSGLR